MDWNTIMKIAVGGLLTLFALIGGTYSAMSILDDRHASADEVKIFKKEAITSFKQMNDRFEAENKNRIIRELGYYRRIIARGGKLDIREKEHMADLELQLEALK